MSRWFTEQQLAEYRVRIGRAIHPAVVAEAVDVAPRRASFTLQLPFPPSLNHNTMPGANGGRYLTPKHRAFRSTVFAIVATEKPAVIGKRFRFELDLHYPDKRKRDADNCIKAVLDALQRAAVLADDHWLRELSVRVIEAKKPNPGKAVVTVIELE